MSRKTGAGKEGARSAPRRHLAAADFAAHDMTLNRQRADLVDSRMAFLLWPAYVVLCFDPLAIALTAAASASEKVSRHGPESAPLPKEDSWRTRCDGQFAAQPTVRPRQNFLQDLALFPHALMLKTSLGRFDHGARDCRLWFRFLESM
jgi:hypothetical protein